MQDEAERPELQLSHWSLAVRDSVALQTLHMCPGPARQVKSLHIPSSRRPWLLAWNLRGLEKSECKLGAEIQLKQLR